MCPMSLEPSLLFFCSDVARIRAIFGSHVFPKSALVSDFQCWLRINYKEKGGGVVVDTVISVCFTNLLDFSQIFVHSFDLKWPTQTGAELDIIFVQLAWV